MNRIFFILLFLVAGITAHGQGYHQAVGIRGGLSSGFEYRYFTDDLNSFKVLLSTRDNGIQLHGFKEIHTYDLFDFAYQLVFFYGAGAHVGYEQWDEVRYLNNSRWFDTKTSFIAGLDALLGVEYVFDAAPVSLGLEVKPYFDLFGRRNFDLQLFDVAFTVKYLF
jgi:hypothetical protein